MICENCGNEINDKYSFISVQDFAKRFGLSTSSIDREIRSGHIQAFEFGGNNSRAGRVLIPESEVEKFFKSQMKAI